MEPNCNDNKNIELYQILQALATNFTLLHRHHAFAVGFSCEILDKN